jgi:hypothetical protein
MRKRVDDPEDCTCDVGCYGFGECACIFIYDDDGSQGGQCVCECESPEPDDIRYLRRLKKLPLRTRIAIRTRRATLAKLGTLLGTFSAARIAIPASAARRRVSLRLKDATLAEVVAKAGLVVLRPTRRAWNTKRR